MPSGAKNWLITFNNPDGLLDLEAIPKLIRGVFQEEIAPLTGTHHLQGYLSFSCARTMDWLKNNVEYTAHYEVARGSPRDNYNYCTKTESRVAGTEPTIFGTFHQITQGARTDLLGLRTAVHNGRTFTQIVEDDELLPVIARHMPFYQRLEAESRYAQARPTVKVTLHYGEAGSGKSHCAGCHIQEDTYMYDGSTFWEGYKDQTKLIMDEFGGHTVSPLTFNRICDKYPYTVNIKNRSAPLMATDIHITTNFTPIHWWKEGTRYNREAVARRIHEAHWHYMQGTTRVLEKFTSDADGYALDKMLAKINQLQ